MQTEKEVPSETATLRESQTAVDPGVLDNEKQVAQVAPPAIPDGGVVAWTTICSWLVLFCTFGYVNAFGVFEDYYSREYMTNKTSSDIAWVGSTQLCLQFAMGLVSGKLFDAGYFHTTIAAGSFIYTFCLFMLSLAKENQYYQVFLPQAVGLGIGLGLLFLPSIGVISHHFRRRRALAMGIVTSGSSCGGIVFPIMLNKIFQRVGFAWGVRSTAFVVLAGFVAANLMMRTRLPPKSQRPPAPPPDVKGIITDSAFQLAVAGSFLVMLGLFLPFFYLQLFSITHGLDHNLAFYSLAILNAASVFGRTVPNFVADKYGPLNLLIPCATISGILIFAMFGVKSSSALIVFGLLYGFFSGAYISLVSPVFVSLSRNMQEIGMRMGLAFFVLGFSALTGTPIAGALLSPRFDWWKPIMFSGIVVLAGAALLVAARAVQVKRKGTSLV
ncbi:major facilitator superfamily transporter [Ceratobasidium sp. AG-Ba]|nr:major facilitator superfamily transporter [Ceratobasidium sp. AG-Ba]